MGQRQLIVGNRSSGKTSLAVNVIVNLTRSNRYYTPEGFGSSRVFVFMSVLKASLKEIASRLTSEACLWYSVLVDATASKSVTMQYIAPFTGSSIAENFRGYGSKLACCL